MQVRSREKKERSKNERKRKIGKMMVDEKKYGNRSASTTSFSFYDPYPSDSKCCVLLSSTPEGIKHLNASRNF